MTKSKAYKRRRAELRRKEAEASVSAFAALRDSSKPGAKVQASNEISTGAVKLKLEDEDSRPVKKRVVAGQPQNQNLPITRGPSGRQDAPFAYGVQPTNVDEKKDELFHKSDKGPLHAASNVTGSQSSGLDGVTRQDNWQDRKPVSLAHNLTLYSSNPESNILYHGSVQELSSFTPTKDNVIGETTEEWTIRLNKADRLTLLGQYDIWVRKGAVAIMGAVIHAGSTVHRVHAPSTHSLPAIRACFRPFMPNNQTAEITILSVSMSGIRQLKEISPAFSRIWNHRSLPVEQSSPNIDFSQRSFTFLKSSADDINGRPLYPVECPLYWRRELDRYRNPLRKHPPIVMVCGLKGTGKSTFCRMLANTLLSNRANLTTASYGFIRRDHLGANGIAFLDLDPGQPEYSPPGEVTLMYMRRFNLGVPYTHPTIGISEPNRLIRAHHIGAVAANDNPQHYQSCALDLFKHYQNLRSEDPLCPLIINCSGWVTASGLEVLVRLIQQMSLSDLVYMQGGHSEVASVLGEAAAKAGTAFQPLVSQQPPILTRAASDLRMMQALSYFHIDEPEGIDLGWNRAPLIEGPPLTVRYSGAQDIFAVMILGQEQDPELYRYILEGSVVGVVVLEDDEAIIGVKDNGQLGSVSAVFLEDDPAMQDDGQLGFVGADLEDSVRRDQDLLGERRQGNKFKFPRTPKQDSASDEGSDIGVIPGSIDSNFGQFPRRRSRKALTSRSIESQPSQTYDKVVNHPLVRRTSEGLPYLYTGAQTGVQPALDPGKSYSLGQALIHGIDPISQMIHLYTPIPTSTLQSLGRQNSKIVLVRGGLDMPTWAFLEDYFAMATRRRQSEPSREGKEDKLLGSEIREWTERTPWATFKDEREERSSARVRHSRRNLRTG